MALPTGQNKVQRQPKSVHQHMIGRFRQCGECLAHRHPGRRGNADPVDLRSLDMRDRDASGQTLDLDRKALPSDG